MNTGELNCFLDKLNYGDEMAFLYKGIKYFVEGWSDEQGYRFFFANLSTDETLFEDCQSSMKACAKHFLALKAFDGHKFLDIAADVEWVDDY